MAGGRWVWPRAGGWIIGGWRDRIGFGERFFRVSESRFCFVAGRHADRQTDKRKLQEENLEYTGIRFLQPVTAEEGASQHGIQRQAVYEDAGCL